MSINRLTSVFAALLLCGATASSAAAPSPAATSLHALFDAAWEYQLAHNPVQASILGDRRWNSQWPDISPTSLNAEHQQMLRFGQQLAAIDRRQLSPADQLNYDLFKQNLDNEDESF